MRYCFIVFFLFLTSSFGKIQYSLLSSKNWAIDKNEVECQIENKILCLNEYQKERYYPKFIKAKERYEPIPVYHLVIDRIDDTLSLDIESSDTPFDLYYINPSGVIKLIVATMDGDIFYVDSYYYSFYKGAAKMAKKTFRRILRNAPEFICECNVMPHSFLVIKDEKVLVYNFFHRKVQSLEEFLQTHPKNLKPKVSEHSSSHR